MKKKIIVLIGLSTYWFINKNYPNETKQAQENAKKYFFNKIENIDSAQLRNKFNNSYAYSQKFTNTLKCDLIKGYDNLHYLLTGIISNNFIASSSYYNSNELNKRLYSLGFGLLSAILVFRASLFASCFTLKLARVSSDIKFWSSIFGFLGLSMSSYFASKTFEYGTDSAYIILKSPNKPDFVNKNSIFSSIKSLFTISGKNTNQTIFGNFPLNFYLLAKNQQDTFNISLKTDFNNTFEQFSDNFTKRFKRISNCLNIRYTNGILQIKNKLEYLKTPIHIDRSEIKYDNLKIQKNNLLSEILNFKSILFLIAVNSQIQKYGHGCKFSSVCPSDLQKRGAFYKISFPVPISNNGSLTSGEQYASLKLRNRIQNIGFAYGCHHCGNRFIFRRIFRTICYYPFKILFPRITFLPIFIGDHIPPVKLSKQSTQQFYPQCYKCSNLQASSVRYSRRKLIAHHAFRFEHIQLPIPLLYILLEPSFTTLIEYLLK